MPTLKFALPAKPKLLRLHEWRRWLGLAVQAAAKRRAEQQARRRQQLEITAMSEYELRDLGLSRAQAAGLFVGADMRPTRHCTPDAWHVRADRRVTRVRSRP